LTGLSVQLIDASLLDPQLIDPSLREAFPDRSLRRRRQLIINIDFAFGKQAEDILDELILMFGECIRSVNILGKAGALVGKRGDILMPTHVIRFNEGNTKAIGNLDLSKERVVQLAHPHVVWTGPVLTVLGTFVQNAEMLRYYEKLWRCIGLEMEGSYFIRSIERGVLRGVLNENVVSRVLYYVSDLPLQATSNLAHALPPWEGIPPLYKLTILWLTEIF
jgi:hypothetical protein